MVTKTMAGEELTEDMNFLENIDMENQDQKVVNGKRKVKVAMEEIGEVAWMLGENVDLDLLKM